MKNGPLLGHLSIRTADRRSTGTLPADDHAAIRHSLLDRHGAAALAAHGRAIAIVAFLAPPALATAIRITDPHAYARAFYVTP
jgi:hypothetical protein